MPGSVYLRLPGSARRCPTPADEKAEEWWEGRTNFFVVERTRLWVLTGRFTHSSHHRGQQTALLRMLGRDLHSTYGPTTDTGGLFINHAPTVYAYPNQEVLLAEEADGRQKAPLSGSGSRPATERAES
jgi:hypothetical protein